MKKIKTRPGTAGYDLLLEAPFPAIEIIRWRQPEGGGRAEPDAKHWFTLDNRRLYCLQRVAAALWPRVVGVAVEVLYSATEGVLRKDDSSTCGRSVGVGHSLKALTGRWDWREAIPVTPDEEADATARRRLAEDDCKASVSQLQDASDGAGSALERCLRGAEVEASVSQLQAASDGASLVLEGCLRGAEGEARAVGSDDSTASSPTPRSRYESDASEPSPGARARGLAALLEGQWQGHKGELYEICPRGQASWVCWRSGEAGGSKRFTLWLDAGSGVIWWGTNYSLYMDVYQFTSRPERAEWYGAQEAAAQKPRFAWQRLDTAKGAETRPRGPQPAPARRQGGKGREGGGSRWVAVQVPPVLSRRHAWGVHRICVLGRSGVI